MCALPKLTPIPEELPEDAEELKSLVRTLVCERQMLHSGLEQALRKRFGISSERLNAQLDVFATAADDPPEKQAELPQGKPAKAKPRKGHGRRRPAVHLERQRVVHDLSEEQKLCPCCEKPRPLIGETKTEQFDYRPASVFVVEHVTLKYGECKCGCEEASGVIEAQKPFQPIEKGLCGAGLLAHVGVSKYADHLPLYRLERILLRHGLEVERSTLWGWICKGGELLEPLVDLMHSEILNGEVINSDDTPLALQAPGKTKTARVWIYVGDPEHPYVLYDFRLDRSRAGPKQMLAGFKGYLQVDAYAGYNVVFVPDGALEAGCWAHARRYFFNAHKLGCTRSQHAMTHFIQRLYEIERKGKALSPEELVKLRQQEALPILQEFFSWMEAQQLQVLPKSPLGKALGYALKNREALMRYTEHGYLGIDNNTSERGMRPVVIGRKNWLFTGSERGGKTAAIFFSVIESAKRHGLDVFGYLHDLFVRLPGHPHSQLADFLPDRWKAAQQSAKAAQSSAHPA